MSIRKTVLAVVFVLLFAVVGCAQGPSFDCAKATTRVEKAICANADLSGLDEELSDLYKKALRKFPELESIKQAQRAWLKRRDRCVSASSLTACVKSSYKGRISDLDPNSVSYKLPVLIEELGENWQYKRDADKLPVMRKAMASGRLKDPSPIHNNDPVCKSFPEDLIASRNFEVIEPDMQIIDRNDPRLGQQRYADAGEKGVIVLDRDDPRVGRWYSCDGIDSVESTASHPKDIFTWFKLKGLLPYNIYRTELDGNSENGPEDVLLFREEGNNYSHDYQWVDLSGCEIKRNIQINSPAHRIYPQQKDALSLLIRYQNEVMVLEYKDWAKKNSSKQLDEISLRAMRTTQKVCFWGDPFGSQ